MIPLIGITIAERLRDRGFDCCICFDDLSKHSRSYRQISLLQNKIPSRDAYPSDIFNIHSSLLERVAYGVIIGPIKNGRSTISCLPIIETINSDISEYIATNVISITDGQFYFNKHLFNLSLRPAIDSSLSVTRIGSNAQCK
jgi:F0F1-type ATP synthase alpha subunit